MLRPIAQLAAVGFVGVFAARLLFALLLPLFGAALGLFIFVVKIILIVSLIGLGWWCFSKFTDRPSEA